MRAVITGATGFVGRRLVNLLDRPRIITRSAVHAQSQFGGRSVEANECDLGRASPPLESLRGAEAVFHLAGESVASGRWTKARKARIRDSRVQGTRNLVDAIAQLSASERPAVLVSASAVGYYGSRGDETLTEDSPAGKDFLAEVCAAWESEASRAEQFGVRTAMLRIGIVLGPNGGALQRMLLPFRMGLGGRLGSGRQWMPWIHVDDLAALFLHVAKTENIHGPVNAVAPQLVRNREFTQTLAKVLHRPAVLPAPYFGLRLMLGEFAQVLFASQKVEPRRAIASGFEYRYPQLEEALRASVARGD